MNKNKYLKIVEKHLNLSDKRRYILLMTLTAAQIRIMNTLLHDRDALAAKLGKSVHALCKILRMPDHAAIDVEDTVDVLLLCAAIGVEVSDTKLEKLLVKDSFLAAIKRHPDDRRSMQARQAVPLH